MTEKKTYLKPEFNDAFTRALREEPRTEIRDVLWSSDLSAALDDGCKRQLFHKLAADERKDKTVGELLLFRFGDRIHEDVAEMIDEYVPGDWTVLGTEVYGNEIEGVVSRSDILLESPEGDEVVVEVKTSRGRAFSYRNGPEDVREAHKLQAQTNCLATGSDYGVLLYIDREGSNAPQSYIIEPDHDRVLSIVEELEELIKPARYYAIARQAAELGLIEHQEVPDPPDPLEPEVKRNKNKGPDSIEISEPWNCDYCGFKNVVCPGAVPDQLQASGVVLKDHGEDGYSIYKDKLDESKLPDLVQIVERAEG